MARILIADDHRLTVEGTVKLLWEEWPDLLTAHTVAKAIRMVDAYSPDLILLDLLFRDCQRSGFAVLEHCQQQQHPARVLITSAFADPETVGWAREHKAHGFIGKHQRTRDLVGAIRTLLAGGEFWPPPPSPDEDTPPLLRLGHRRVLGCLAAGMTYVEAARVIGISEATVDKYIQEARKRLGARNTSQAVAIAERRGLLLLRDVHVGPPSGGGGESLLESSSHRMGCRLKGPGVADAPRMVAEPLGWLLGALLYPVEWVLNRVVREGPSVELMVCRKQ